jgi:hypothetical protein
LNLKHTVALVLAALVICGCRNEEPQADHNRNSRLLEPPPQPLTIEGMMQDELPSIPQLKPWTDTAVKDLAEKLSASPEDIEVLEARYVTWPDSSLGCPQPDMGYLQALTSGLLIVLRHRGASYHYHGRSEGPPFYCERPRKPVAGEASEATR